MRVRDWAPWAVLFMITVGVGFGILTEYVPQTAPYVTGALFGMVARRFGIRCARLYLAKRAPRAAQSYLRRNEFGRHR